MMVNSSDRDLYAMLMEEALRRIAISVPDHNQPKGP